MDLTFIGIIEKLEIKNVMTIFKLNKYYKSKYNNTNVWKLLMKRDFDIQFNPKFNSNFYKYKYV